MAVITAAASSSSCLAASKLSSCHSRGTPKVFLPVKGFHSNASRDQKTILCQASESQAESRKTFRITRREALSAAVAIVGLSQMQAPASAQEEFVTFYGKAASASSYGGYGGNAGTTTEAEYKYYVPAGWKERVISKVEKGTNGTDSEWYNPANKKEKIYTTYLGGFRKLGPKENIINDLALSDVKIQDALGSAESFDQRERTDESGQLYYDYEIANAGSGHTLITVTVARNKLYAVFVQAPNAAWSKDEEKLRKMWSSFTTI